MEEDDFTFPTVAPEGRLGRGDDGDPVVARPLQLPLPDLAAASPLWPFAGSPKAAAPSPSSSPVARDEEPPETRVSGSNGREREEEHRAAAAEEREERGAAVDEERMDLLWEGAPTTATSTTAPAPRSTGSGGGHAEPPPPNPKQQQKQRAESDGDKQRAAAVADAERMDKLWESFNEEPLLLRRARSKSTAAGDRPGGATDWYICSYPASDAESEGTSASSPAERRGYGCAPTMLRASSRAGGAGQFCGSPRGRRGSSRGAAAGWALLLRLFRRLFAVDKAPAPSSSRSHATVYVP